MKVPGFYLGVSHSIDRVQKLISIASLMAFFRAMHWQRTLRRARTDTSFFINSFNLFPS